jgi:hypothetical protein
MTKSLNSIPSYTNYTQMAVTTIKLQRETKQRLDKLKEHSRESYDEILKKVLYVLNVVRESPDKAKGILEFIDEKRLRNLDQKDDEEEE